MEHLPAGPLTETQVTAFWRDGYVLMDGAVSTGQLAALRGAVAGWVEESRDHDGPWGTTMDGRGRFDVQPGHSAERPALRRVASPQEVCDVHLRIMRDSALVDAAAQLVGPNLVVNNVKTNCKQPGAGTAVRFHQDFAYEAHSNDDLLAALLFVDDVTLDNGPLEVVPGSHKWGILGENDFRGRDLEAQIARIEARSGRAFATVCCQLEAGCVSFHNGATIHGSRANRSNSPRRSLVVHMIPDGTCFKGGTPADDNWYNLWIQAKDGDPYAGPYFPVIYRENDALANPWAVERDA